MNIAKNPTIGFASAYNKATKDFIAKWFGNDKLFDKDQAIQAVEDKLTNDTQSLFEFLRANRTQLKTMFEANSLVSKDSSGFTYDKLVNGLKNKEYNTDSNFRSNLESVIDYIITYGPVGGPIDGYWPKGLAMQQPGIDFTSLPADFKSWFVAPTAYIPPRATTRIDDFKKQYSDIFSELLDSKNTKILQNFLQQADSTIKKPLTSAIEQTDYANKESPDFVPEKYPDEKNWVQNLQDKIDDTYEDYFRKFTNSSRGSRIYFSPWAQNIIKAFDKEKIKPTDGLKGILDKKDAILKRLDSSSTAKGHFDWFSKKMEQLQKDMPKAFEGALRNGSQMRALVSALIVKAVKEGETDKAKTALEILSVAKYGLSSSRTMDAINKTDVNVFSDGKLSWNKNEGIQFVTKAFDRTIKTGIQGIGYAVTGTYNFIQHRRTKIGDDIRNNPILKKAHEHWNEEDVLKEYKEARQNLTDLAAGHGPGESGTVINDATTLAAAEAALAGMTPASDPYKKLKKDIDTYKQAITKDPINKIAEIEARQHDRALPANKDKDPYRELIAYWDMLETVSKTHSFTLGSMSVKRKALLNGWDNKNSLAQRQAEAYIKAYNQLRTAKTFTKS